MPVPPFLDCWYLTGPTAAGKTAVGVELAGRIGAEIVSMDSMAVYRGMDIGTAKPTPAERGGIPHHLIDILDPHQPCSLAQYLGAAGSTLEQIASRGRAAIFVGGTPLYLKALLRGIFEGPPADWSLRRRLRDEEAVHGPGRLHRRLNSIDPAAAARLHPNDTRRLIRALEVFEKTGRPISELQAQFEIGRPPHACRVFVLDWPRQTLYERVNRRVEAMFAAGLVEEVRRLFQNATPLSRTARQAVGYREVIEHLEGRHSLEETIDLVQRHTRHFAKRQCTWFRSLSECRFVPVAEPLRPAEIADRIAATVSADRDSFA